MSATKTLIIIPARAGSKRLPGKNMMDFDGQPLIGHSIDYALLHKSATVDIVVSSDAPQILEYAKEKGVMTLQRPEHLASDTASTASVLQHAVQTLPDDYVQVVLLQVTNPLRPKHLLQKALTVFTSQHLTSLCCISPLDKKFGVCRNGNFLPKNYSFGERSQDVEPLFFENGLLYITSVDAIREGIIITKDNVGYILDHPYAQVDIDTQSDFDYALFLKRNSLSILWSLVLLYG